MAGEQAKDRGATGEAKRYFDRALERIPPDDLDQRWRMLLGRNDTLAMLGDIAPRLENQALLLELADQLDDTRRAEAYYRQGNLLDHQGDYQAAFNQCVADGNALCVGVGFLLYQTISNTASLNPGVNFALLDWEWGSTRSNLRGIGFEVQEAAYLAGTLAGHMTEGEKIGAIGRESVTSSSDCFCTNC